MSNWINLILFILCFALAGVIATVLIICWAKWFLEWWVDR